MATKKSSSGAGTSTKTTRATRPTISSSHKSRPVSKSEKKASKADSPPPKSPARRSPAPTREAAPDKTPTPEPPRSSRVRKDGAPASETRKELRKARASQPPRKLDLHERSREQAMMIARAAADKKALNVQVIDVGGRVDYADFLVVMTGNSDRHVAAIVQSIVDALKESKTQVVGVEGLNQASWVVIDVGDVWAHVFLEEMRQQYDLEGLWLDAPRVEMPTDLLVLPTEPLVWLA